METETRMTVHRRCSPVFQAPANVVRIKPPNNIGGDFGRPFAFLEFSIRCQGSTFSPSELLSELLPGLLVEPLRLAGKVHRTGSARTKRRTALVSGILAVGSPSSEAVVRL